MTRQLPRLCLPVVFLFCLALLEGCAPTMPKDTENSGIISAERMQKTHDLNQEWWKLYGQKELDQAVDMALARNIDLARAAIAVNKARYQAGMIGADLLPAFSSNASAQATKTLSSGASATKSFQGSLGLSYELDLWHKLALSVSAQEWEVSATAHDRESTRLALINAVTDGWFNIKYLRRSLALSKDNVLRYEKLLAIAETKHQAGKVDSVEPLQTRQLLLTARNKVLSTESSLARAVASMRDLLNLRPGEAFPENGVDLLAIRSVAPDLGVPVAALAARPDVAAAEARLNSMFTGMKATERSWFPEITLGPSVGVSSNKANTLFDAPFLSGLIRISFPFLDWNRLRWQTKAAEADFENAKLAFTSTVTSAVNEVDTAYITYRKSLDTLETIQAKARADRALADYYATKYALGASELKDYLDALNSASNSADAVVEAKYQALSNELRIHQAMGGRYEAKPSGQSSSPRQH